MTNPNAKILIVDDVYENRDLLVRRLRRLGFKSIDQAENGVQALEAVAGTTYDLMLLDIMMPELDGFGVLEQLAARKRSHDLPVIVISALNEMESLVRCIELGADDFILKPFNPTLLRARVLSSLDKKEMRDRLREELNRKHLELHAARTLQMALVPPPMSAEAGGLRLTIDALLEPANEVGGDLVDFFRIGSDLVAVTLGDVSDKGAGAALMMARTHGIMRGLASRPDAVELFAQPERAVGSANAALAHSNAGCMFVTYLLLTLNMSTGEARYVRAGHIPPYLRTADGAVLRLAALGGPALGLDETAVYTSERIEIGPGACLLSVTDGITEALAPGGARYGDDAVVAFTTTIQPNQPDVLKRLVADVRKFEDGLAPFDDVAAFVMSLVRHHADHA